MERSLEDAICTICQGMSSDPVFIDCGHSFCQGCLTAHWSGVSALQRHCPECQALCTRAPCTRDKPGQHPVEKIPEQLQEETEPQELGAELMPGRPVQLVRLDEDGGLILDEEALSRCLEQGGVGGAPVCLVSVIGEQRRGKSFLLNCLLHRLRSPKATDTLWMSGDNAGLEEFACRSGTATVTRGVWIWSQPFWVQSQGRRVAVFLVDTEGCLDLQRDMETSIKLSVFSILLSSYWIFNVSSTLTRTEADYLEVFLHIAKEVGGTCNLPPIEPLDLLVRDWQLSEAYGMAGGQEYLRDITWDLEASSEQPLVLGALQASGTRCYLLPHPGRRFTRSGAGTSGDMDEGFRQHLCDYVSSLAHAAGTHVRTDRAGKELSGAQLAASIKDVSRYLQTRRYDFSSPLKMTESLAQMREEKNRKAVETAKREYQQFVQQQGREMHHWLSMKLEEMRRRMEGKRQELLERCRNKLQGEASHQQAALDELQQELGWQMDQVLSSYELHFQMMKKAVWVGLAIGGVALVVMGAGVWLGAVVLAVEEAMALAGSLGLFGGLLGTSVKQKPAENKMGTRAPQQGNEGRGGAVAQFLPAYEQHYKEKKAVRLGLAIGGTVLGAVGAGVGAAIGFCVAMAVVAVGVGAGGLGAIGAAVEGRLGAWFGWKSAQYQTDTNAPRQGAEGPGGAGDSDRVPLLQADA